ncbi:MULTISPECIES: sporulation protein YqfC [Shouchella]|uniref:Sporulation protein YqfC n=3 Tax=Bacillaceae TaxID=186817 RepID=A0A060LW95_9BACI|nr:MULTISPECIES: sporulation protein YqfC [Bacillaceae]RQW19978.1 sporulation protein YqfC [Bacillus sp. C1-1]AIC94060.1 sporulation protein YqfC [Shouchella lehensis G1]KQL58009.1 sporulation protein YqfC [Alkalicoccobacillus plakortidis]MBG9785694.1 sporulation protein YqfC [Shouchella lehensis]TES48155.1 sporulation protein YqfC [Shouchella lehensis]
MSRMTNRIKKWVTEQMQLPADVTMDLPRITMIGQLHIYIENHRGVLQFSNKELRLLLKEGQLLVTGDQFVLKTILPEELLLEGRIDKVMFINEEEK